MSEKKLEEMNEQELDSKMERISSELVEKLGITEEKVKEIELATMEVASGSFIEDKTREYGTTVEAVEFLLTKNFTKEELALLAVGSIGGANRLKSQIASLGPIGEMILAEL